MTYYGTIIYDRIIYLYFIQCTLHIVQILSPRPVLSKFKDPVVLFGAFDPTPENLTLPKQKGNNSNLKHDRGISVHSILVLG